MIKVFTPNADGKIEFTKDELEKLLNEVWMDGKNSRDWWWASPTPTNWLPTTITTTHTVEMNTDGVEVQVREG